MQSMHATATTAAAAPAEGPASGTTGAHRRWRKVLYESQADFPDNHVDGTFLASLVTNANVKSYTYVPLVASTATVTLQLTTVALFMFLYTVVLQETLSAKVLLGLDVVGGLGGYAVCYFTLPLDKRHLLPRDASLAKNLVVVAALLMVLSPVLMTLTRSYSDDTIWALSMLFVTMCLFSHDYTGRTDRPTTFSGTTSLNAAMFASVLLASRLPSTLHVFAVVALSIELFALFPIMRRCILVRSKRAYLSFTFGLFVLAGALLASLSTVVAYVFLLGVAFITLGAPMIMLVLQKHKREIQGPWDIAKPTVMADQR